MLPPPQPVGHELSRSRAEIGEDLMAAAWACHLGVRDSLEKPWQEALVRLQRCGRLRGKDEQGGIDARAIEGQCALGLAWMAS